MGRKGIWDVGCDSGGHQGSEGQTTQNETNEKEQEKEADILNREKAAR